MDLQVLKVLKVALQDHKVIKAHKVVKVVKVVLVFKENKVQVEVVFQDHKDLQEL